MPPARRIRSHSKAFGEEDLLSIRPLAGTSTGPIADRSSENNLVESVHVPCAVREWWTYPDSPCFRPGSGFGDFGKRIATSHCGGNGAITAVALLELRYRNLATLEGVFHGRIGADLPLVASDGPSARIETGWLGILGLGFSDVAQHRSASSPRNTQVCRCVMPSAQPHRSSVATGDGLLMSMPGPGRLLRPEHQLRF